MYYERLTKQLIIAEELYFNGHSLQAFLLMYDLLRRWHLTKHCSYNVLCDDKNNINEIEESECYNESNKVYNEYSGSSFNNVVEAENNIECPCFPAYLRREEVLVRVHAVEYLLAAKPTYTEYNSTKLCEWVSGVSAIGEALIEKLRLALRLLQPLFTCEESEMYNNNNNDINSMNYNRRNEGNKFITTQVGNNNSSSFINSITISAVVWQTLPFTLQLPLSTTENEESRKNQGIEQYSSNNKIKKNIPTRWWNVQIGPALSAVRVPLSLIMRSYILRAKCQTALKELHPHDKISWQSILINLQDASRWIRLAYNSGTLHHNREDLLDELCERVQNVSTRIITCNFTIDNTQSRQINNKQSNKIEEEWELYKKESERESFIDVKTCENNNMHTTLMESQDECGDDHYINLERLRNDVDDKLNIVLERERVYCHAALSLECCHVLCKQLNELRVNYNKMHASKLHKRQWLEQEEREYELSEEELLLPTIMKYRSEYKTCLHALYTHASNYKLLKRWLERSSCSSSKEEQELEMSSHYYKQFVAADDSINGSNAKKKQGNDFVHETSDVNIRAVLHSGCYSAMCSSDTNKLYSCSNNHYIHYEEQYYTQNKEHLREEYSILCALEEYYYWSVTLLQSCSSEVIPNMPDEQNRQRHQYEWNEIHTNLKISKANTLQTNLHAGDTTSFDHESELEELLKKSNEQIVYQSEPSKQYRLLYELCQSCSNDNLYLNFDTRNKSESSQYSPFTHSLSHITRHALRSYLDIVNDMDWEIIRKCNNEQSVYSSSEKCISDHIYCDNKQFDVLEPKETNDNNHNYSNNVRVTEKTEEKEEEEEKMAVYVKLKGKIENVFVTIDNTLVAIKEISKSKLSTLTNSLELSETDDKRTTHNVQENGYDKERISVINNPYKETQFLLLLKSCTFCTLSCYNISKCNVNDAIQNLSELQQFCIVFRAYTLPLLVEIHILLACLALQLSIRNVDDLECVPAEKSQRQSQTTVPHHNKESKEQLQYYEQHESRINNDNNEQTYGNKIENVFRYCSELEQNALCDVGIAFAHLQTAEHILVHKSLYCHYATLVFIQLLKTLSLYLMSNRGEELHVMHISRDKTNSFCKQEKEIHSTSNVMHTFNSHTDENKYEEDYQEKEEEEYKNKIHNDNTETCDNEEHLCKRTRWETFDQCTQEEHAPLENNKERKFYKEEEQEKLELLEWQSVYTPIPAMRQHRTSTFFTEMLARITQQYIRHATEQLSLRLSTENVYNANNLHSLSQMTSLQEWCTQIEQYELLLLLHESTVAPLFYHNFSKADLANVHSSCNTEEETVRLEESEQSNKSYLLLYHDHIWTEYNVVMLFLLHGLHERDEEKNMNSAHYYFTRAHEFIAGMIKQKDKNNSGSSFCNSIGSNSQYLQLFDMIISNSYSSIKEKGQVNKENNNSTTNEANKTYDKLQSQIRKMCKHKTLFKLRSILSFDLKSVDPSHNHRT